MDGVGHVLYTSGRWCGPTIPYAGQGYHDQVSIILVHLSKATLQDGTYQSEGAYHTTHEARLDHAGARAAWSIRGLWGVSLLNSREKLLNQEYDDWHLTSTDPCKPFESSGRTRIQMLISRSGSSTGPCS